MSESVFGDLDGLLEHVDSKFTLVNVVTKRAKQLNNGAPPYRRIPTRTSRCRPRSPKSPREDPLSSQCVKASK
jgi:DNA-directed RNA polymerase omega subunit